MARKQNEKEGFKYWPAEDNTKLKSQYRYIRIYVESFTDADGE